MSYFMEILCADGFIAIDKTLLRAIGQEKAFFLSFLFDKYKFYRTNNMLIDGEFFIRFDDWTADTGQTRHSFDKCVHWAEEMGLISTHLQGIPAKKFYRMHVPVIDRFMRNVYDENINPKPTRKKSEHKPTPSSCTHMYEPVEYDDDTPPPSIITSDEEADNTPDPVTPCESKDCGNTNQALRIRKAIDYQDLKEDISPPKAPPKGEGVGLLSVESVQSTKPKSTLEPQDNLHPVPEKSSKSRNHRLAAMSESEKEKLQEDVSELVEWYRDNGKKEDKTRSRGKQRIQERLLDGWRKERLLRALQRYVWSTDQEYRESVDCENDGSVYPDPKYYYGIGNFFGKDAHFLRYLDEEVDWNMRCYPWRVAQQRERNRWYRHLKKQYQEAYGEKWKRELHKTKPWATMWEDCVRDLKNAFKAGTLKEDSWEEAIYGDYGVPEDESLCPGRKVYARDYDEEDDVCAACACREECKCDLEAFQIPEAYVVDQMSNKWLKKPDYKAIQSEIIA